IAAAGVGKIGIADCDYVEVSNLQRQVLFSTPDIGKKKVDSAREKISSLNPEVKIDTYHIKIDNNKITELIRKYDFIIDATDNFKSKFLINDACVFNRKPFSHAGVLGFEGQTFTYTPGYACYRCIFSRPPEKGDIPEPGEAGIIGFVPGIIGTIQSGEAIRFLLGTGDLLLNRVLIFNGLKMEFKIMNIVPDPSCPVCGKNPTIQNLDE
ncbi:MAG: HesA/MoeB/ThiF family protein, partial [Spirochaetes bacterium]|nr:HesA/MoeB/ThiF family protein [Spirochaetota bacterium]